MGLFVRQKVDGTTLISSDPSFESGPPERHHFGKRWLDQQISKGFAVRFQDRIILNETIVYIITGDTGAYCSDCGVRLGDHGGRTPEEAKALRQQSVDHGCSPGYEVRNYYDAKLLSPEKEQKAGILRRLFG